MFTVHPTKKLLDRLRRTPEPTFTEATTTLGNWYATAIFWKPQQVALFVNEQTLLPVLMPLAPATTVFDRFPGALRDVLQAQEIPRTFVDAELAEMGECQVAKTSNRGVIGTMNEFCALAEVGVVAARSTDSCMPPPLNRDPDESRTATCSECLERCAQDFGEGEVPVRNNFCYHHATY